MLKSLSPDQAVLRIVRDEMVEILGGATAKPLERASVPPTVILMAGLQGSGKTTTSAKLGRWLAGRDFHPLLVSTDVQRPAAREQLLSVGQQAGVKVHHPDLGVAREILRSALDEARAIGHDTVIVDTAGRLHIDDELMAELAELRALANPSEVLYVADAMTGQDAVRSADEFHRKIGITGIVLTQARRRLARGRRALGRGRDRAARQVRRHRREGGRARAVRAGAHGLAHPRPGRRARADRARGGDRRARARPRSWSASCGARSSRSRTTASRCGSSARWVRSTR